jgi:hypothetical protein
MDEIDYPEPTGETAGGASPTPVVLSADDALTRSLEMQKFRLLSQIAHAKKVKSELETKIKAAEAKALEKQKRLGDYNALFMKIGEEANQKAPRQKLGAREAVLGTKRIIERELLKMSKECAVTEMQLNKTKARNAHLRHHVDALRKEHMTFKKLFGAMSEELSAVKARINNTKQAIDEGYKARDHAQEDMVDLSKQFELDKLERGQEWQLFSEAIEKANNEGMPDSLEGGSGLLTQEEEDQLRKKIRKGQMKMAKDRAVLQMAEQKLAAFSEALQYMRTATGYDNLQDAIDLFNRYEDEKFSKVGAANRMVDEIERLERDVVDLRNSLKTRDIQQTVFKEQRKSNLSRIEDAASDMDRRVLETAEQAAVESAEVRAMFRTIEFMFHAIGCDQAFLPEAPVAQRSSSPLRSKTASLKMYTSSVSTSEEVKTGITMATVPQFMGIIENRSADIIQQYVAMLGNSLPAAAGSGRAGQLEAQLAATKAAAASTSAASALAPSRPSGRLKESVASSTLVTALAIDSSKLELPSSGKDDDDDVRPLSLDELKRQAVRQLDTDKNFRQVRASAIMASQAMTRQ